MKKPFTIFLTTIATVFLMAFSFIETPVSISALRCNVHNQYNPHCQPTSTLTRTITPTPTSTSTVAPTATVTVTETFVFTFTPAATQTPTSMETPAVSPTVFLPTPHPTDYCFPYRFAIHDTFIYLGADLDTVVSPIPAGREVEVASCYYPNEIDTPVRDYAFYLVTDSNGVWYLFRGWVVLKDFQITKP